MKNYNPHKSTILLTLNKHINPSDHFFQEKINNNDHWLICILKSPITRIFINKKNYFDHSFPDTRKNSICESSPVESTKETNKGNPLISLIICLSRIMKVLYSVKKLTFLILILSLIVPTEGMSGMNFDKSFTNEVPKHKIAKKPRAKPIPKPHKIKPKKDSNKDSEFFSDSDVDFDHLNDLCQLCFMNKEYCVCYKPEDSFSDNFQEDEFYINNFYESVYQDLFYLLEDNSPDDKPKKAILLENAPPNSSGPENPPPIASPKTVPTVDGKKESKKRKGNNTKKPNNANQTPNTSLEENPSKKAKNPKCPPKKSQKSATPNPP